MTGRDLIIYILQNGLEDKPIFGNGTILNFMSEEQFAAKMSVGVATVRAWIKMDCLTGVRIGDVYYIPKNYKEWGELPAITDLYHVKGSEDNE